MDGRYTCLAHTGETPIFERGKLLERISTYKSCIGVVIAGTNVNTTAQPRKNPKKPLTHRLLGHREWLVWTHQWVLVQAHSGLRTQELLCSHEGAPACLTLRCCLMTMLRAPCLSVTSFLFKSSLQSPSCSPPPLHLPACPSTSKRQPTRLPVLQRACMAAPIMAEFSRKPTASISKELFFSAILPPSWPVEAVTEPPTMFT